MSKILIIDGDTRTAERAQRAMHGMQVQVLSATDSGAGLDLLKREKPDILILDLGDGEEGLSLLEQVRKTSPKTPTVVTATEPRADIAIHAMCRGAYDFYFKPLPDEFLQAIARKALKAAQPPPPTRPIGSASEYEKSTDLPLVGRCPEMVEIYKLVGRVAPTDANVLIQGPSGTGKELIAQAIHKNSPRCDKPFLITNCAAIPDTLLESELFGYEKGAFTGADSRRIGRFEQCNGGTLFLDEIGDMSPSTQSKMLRILQDQTFERLGGSHSLRVDVRIIAATNKSLVECVRKGEFRVDLFYRLKVVSIFLPPLTERGGDLDLLTDYFIRRYSELSNKKIEGISEEAMEVLRQHRWPGNVRELENTVESAVVLGNGPVILAEHLQVSDEIGEEEGIPGSFEERVQRMARPFFKEAFEDHQGSAMARLSSTFEKAMAEMAMEKVGKNQVHAAQLLGISRNTLRKLLQL